MTTQSTIDPNQLDFQYRSYVNDPSQANTYALNFDYNGQPYTFIPQSVVTNGLTNGNSTSIFPYFLNQDNLNSFLSNSTSVDFNGVSWYGDYLKNTIGASTNGYLIPGTLDASTLGAPINYTGVNITGLETLPSSNMLGSAAGQLAYGVSDPSHTISYITASNPDTIQYTDVHQNQSGGGGFFGDLLSSMGGALMPLADIAALAVGQPELIPAINAGMAAGQTIGSGGSITQAATNAAKSAAISAVGSNISADTQSALAGSAAAGATGAVLNGKNPVTGALTGALSSTINNLGNSSLNNLVNAPTSSGGLPSASSLPTTTEDQTPTTDSSSDLNTDLTSGQDVGGLGLTQATSPNLTSMNGAQGATLPTLDGGVESALGYSAPDASPNLGDTSSFINNPDVLGTAVENTDTSNNITLPQINFASAILPTATASKSNSQSTNATPSTQSSASPSSLPTDSMNTSLPTNSMNNLSLGNLSLGNLSLGNLSLGDLSLQGIQNSQNSQNSSHTSSEKSSYITPEQLAQINQSIIPNTGEASAMKRGGLAHFATGSSTTGAASTLKVPTTSNLDDYTQIDTSIDPTEDLVLNGRLVTPQQETLLSSDPTLFYADGGNVDNSVDQDMQQPSDDKEKYTQLMSLLIPELMQILQLRNMPQETEGYADGSSVLSVDRNPSAASIFNDAAKELSPQLMKIYQPNVLMSRSSAQPAKLQPLTQIAQGPLSGLIHHAHGGEAHKYHEAAPEGHHPEFITGLTGYYAHGKGTGQSDDIPAMLHDGDYVADADLVAALGDGSSKAGAHVLDEFRRSIPHHHASGGQPVPAKIADGEYVFPESFVTALGRGNNKAGAKLLDKMREEVRSHKRSAPDTKIPPKAKSPLEYLKMAKG